MHLDTFLFILLIAAAILFQLLSRVVTKMRQKDDNSENERRGPTSVTRTRPPISRTPIESDEERIRKFLEALGQPPTSKPPPSVLPRIDIPPRPLAPVQPPTAQVPPPWKLTREERRKRMVILQEDLQPESARRAEKISVPKTTVAPAFEVHEGPLPAESPPPIVKTPTEVYGAATRPVAKGKESKTDIATLLASTTGLRDAIILREILGEPRGLQGRDAML
jgi:hypothetical protein